MSTPTKRREDDATGPPRHYWVVFKLLLTVVATMVLLLQLDGIESMRAVAAETSLSAEHLREDQISLVVHAAGGILVLLATVVLAIFKPRGTTRYGRRKSLRAT